MLEGLDEAQHRQSTIRQERIKAETRITAQTITAPVKGVVQQLAVHSVGAIVTPAQQLMVIVPARGTMEVEAVLENKDIGFVEVGQQAEVKIDTFPFTKYGTIAGEVVGLSSDAVADDRMGLVYKMRVAMKRSSVEVNGKHVDLQPGMAVAVEAKTGTRRIMEFFLSPLLRYAKESARER
ncbi:MAG: HlyD family type I secretion periplasmic adaptor subunit [Sedimenticolaceae bacterium]